MTISEMLARNARMYPDDVALIELKPSHNIRTEITWREFDERVNKISNALTDMGVRKNDKVIQLMMNSINWLEVYFGIIRTGAWAVPLNFRFNSGDIKYCADIAEAKALIMGEEFIERIESIRSELSTVKSFVLDSQDSRTNMVRLEDIISGSSSQPLNISLDYEDACALYFTSGTTGEPKPVLLTHKNLVCAAITENRHHLQEHEDNFVLLPPLYHCGAKMHWFGNLIVGARATILTEIKPRYILESVHKERGTIVWLLVPWAHDILDALDRGELDIGDYDLSCWRLMHIGAQPVPTSLVRRWKKYFPHMQYDENYGLSEATGPGSIHLGIGNYRKLGATGKPGFNWEARIVDESGKDVAAGEVGEVIIKGDGVMRGYYKNPELTSRIIKDGWLYTGDMGKMDDEGFIYVTDRKRDIVISGGENIYPVEIEEILHNHPMIYDVAVIGVPDERLVEIPAAVIETKPGKSLTEEELRKYCAQYLPQYKQPKRIFFDKVPRNPTGKIEKAKLRHKYSIS